MTSHHHSFIAVVIIIKRQTIWVLGGFIFVLAFRLVVKVVVALGVLGM